jgi:hypothetical protein
LIFHKITTKKMVTMKRHQRQINSLSLELCVDLIVATFIGSFNLFYLVWWICFDAALHCRERKLFIELGESSNFVGTILSVRHCVM